MGISINVKVVGRNDLLIMDYLISFEGKKADKESIDFLKHISELQMQRIANKLSLGKFKKSLILKRANSIYSSGAVDIFGEHYGTMSKRNYPKWIFANDYSINVSVLHN